VSQLTMSEKISESIMLCHHLFVEIKRQRRFNERDRCRACYETETHEPDDGQLQQPEHRSMRMYFKHLTPPTV